MRLVLKEFSQKTKRRRPTRRFFVFLTAGVIILCVFYPKESFYSEKAEKIEHDVPREIQVESPLTSNQYYDGSGESRFLVLVNWENEVDPNWEQELIPMEEVFDSEVLFEGGSINITAGEAAKEMFLAAHEEGIALYKITTAYRSVDYQNELWNERTQENPSYGQNPYQNPVRVLPGNRSEHTTGLALDILSTAYDKADDSYGETKEGRWLAENCWKYGFILRYPKGKESITGVIYEPWHFRFVGKKDAAEIFEKGYCLEEYAARMNLQ